MALWNRKSKCKKYREDIQFCISRFEREIGEHSYPPIVLSEEKFPEEFLDLFKLANHFGQSCDDLRWYYINKATESELENMIIKIQEKESELACWTEKALLKTFEETALFFLFTSYLDAQDHLRKLNED